MQIKKVVRYVGSDVVFKIPLSNNMNTVGSDGDIDKIVDRVEPLFINPIVDNEVKRIMYESGVTANINFKYYNYSGSTYTTSLIDSGNFTLSEYDSYDQKLLNSFYIFDVFDSPNVLKQSRIYRSYLSKIHVDNAFTISNRTNQLNSIFIPSYLVQSDTTEYYGRLMFYNAKRNRIITFYNESHNGDTVTINKMFFKLSVNSNTKRWYFTEPANAIEIVETGNAFVNKVNSSMEGFEVIKPVYAAGTKFDYTNIDYV